MEIRESDLTAQDPRTKIITVEESLPVGKRKIYTETPVFMHDALDTTITIVDPLQALRTDEERAIYLLSSLKKYSLENVYKLNYAIKQLQMEEVDREIKEDLERRAREKGEEPNPTKIFFAKLDILTARYCERIGDTRQEKRVDVLLRTHALAYPGVFDHVNEYSQRTFHRGVNQLVLTQDDPIMQQVYRKMFQKAGLGNIDVITVPDKRFDKLRKNNPELYAKLAAFFEREPYQMGLYDDADKNLNAARQAGVFIQLATGVKNNDTTIVDRETEQLIRLLFEEPNLERA